MVNAIKNFIIKLIRSNHVISLGRGTTKLAIEVSGNRGNLLLIPIEKSITGEKPGAEIKDAERATIEFSNPKSVEIMIEQLESLHQQMLFKERG